MSIQDKRRELFEAGINIRTRMRNEHGDYVLGEVRDRWDGFNAALDAVVIQLPVDLSLSASDDPWYVRDLCKYAIESAGLRVKK